MSSISTGNSPTVPPISTSLFTMFIPTPVPPSIAQAQIMRAEISAGQGDSLKFVQLPLLPTFPNVIPDRSSGPSPITFSYYSRDILMSIVAQSTIFDVKSVYTSQIDWIAKTIEAQQISTVRTEDFIVSQTLSATANTIYASAGTNGDIPSNFTSIDANNITAALLNENAPKTTANLQGENRIGTDPRASGFIMLTSSLGIGSFYNDSNFKKVAFYSDPEIALPYEEGSFDTLRVLCSSDWPVFNDGLSINGNPIIQGSVTSIQSYAIVMHTSMYRRISAVGSTFYGANMLQVGTSAQSFFGVGIVQPSWVYNVLYTII